MKPLQIPGALGALASNFQKSTG